LCVVFVFVFQLCLYLCDCDCDFDLVCEKKYIVNVSMSVSLASKQSYIFRHAAHHACDRTKATLFLSVLVILYGI